MSGLTTQTATYDSRALATFRLIPSVDMLVRRTLVDVGGGPALPLYRLLHWLPYSVKKNGSITDTSLARSSAKPRQTLKGSNG